MKTRISFALFVASLSLVMPLRALADQVRTVTGDMLSGKVISLNTDTLVLQNESLGTMRVPRSKVAVIVFGTNAPMPAAVPLLSAPGASTPAPAAANASEFSSLMRQLGTNSALIQQMQNQFLGGAGPEANSKFNELLNGLMSGSLTLTDLRGEAKNSANQLRALKRDLGEDGWAVDGYLSILDHFLKETDATDSKVIITAPPVKKP